jgi:hypothetical protein
MQLSNLKIILMAGANIVIDLLLLYVVGGFILDVIREINK